MLLVALREDFGLPGDLMAYMLLGRGRRGHRRAPDPALVTAVGAGILVNWYLTEPYHTLTIAEAENSAALLVFVLVGITVSLLVSPRRTARRRRAAGRARGRVPGPRGRRPRAQRRPPPLDARPGSQHLPARRGGALHPRRDRAGTSSTRPANPIPADPDAATLQVDVGDIAVLALTGAVPTADDRMVLGAFAAQLAIALEQRRLRAEAAEAAVVAEGDALRTALLQAVSHDLRTPLASIKASVSSLLQDDVRVDRGTTGTSSTSPSTRRPTASTGSSATSST